MQSAEYFILSARKIWVWWVGYLTWGREIPGSQCMPGFQPECCLWKCQYSTISKKQNFKASGVYTLPLAIEGSVPSGIPHALTIRLGMGARPLPDGVGACSVPCQMSCCCLRGCHSYLPRVHAVGGVAECSPCLPQRNAWISGNVPGVPLYGSTLFAWRILCTHQSLSYFCGGFVHLVNFD